MTPLKPLDVAPVCRECTGALTRLSCHWWFCMACRKLLSRRYERHSPGMTMPLRDGEGGCV